MLLLTMSEFQQEEEFFPFEEEQEARLAAAAESRKRQSRHPVGHDALQGKDYNAVMPELQRLNGISRINQVCKMICLYAKTARLYLGPYNPVLNAMEQREKIKFDF